MAETFTVQAGYGMQRRDPVTIAVGKWYRVDQMNKQAMKHRDRTGVIVEIDPGFHHEWVRLKFDDNGRIAKFSPGDLVYVET